MYRANYRQVEELNVERLRREGAERQQAVRSFVTDFLFFADETTPLEGPSEVSLLRPGVFGFTQVIKRQCTSRYFALPTEKDSPEMGAVIVAYTNEIHSKRRLLSRVLTAADVRVGPVLDDLTSSLVGLNTVLRVIHEPTSVYFDPTGARLASIDPGSTKWKEMESLLGYIKNPRVLEQNEQQ